GDIKQDIKDIRGYRLTDLLLVGGGIIASFVLLASMMIAGYFRLEDKIQIISTAQTRIETKLEDLLARIPPMQTPPRR
ncbi:MAG TPA: hypothetical protein VHD34_08295, partial [Xanthobacteraceae bacterium]|nr:hypothetical protein [Xanthobacteraceae bacterium]